MPDLGIPAFARVLNVAQKMAECQPTVLASLVAQVRGVMFYGLQMYVAREGEHVVLVRRPNNPYDNNCLDVWQCP